jgi:hypothetical protein
MISTQSKDWHLSGSNNGTSWTVLDTRIGEDFPTRLLTRTFAVNNDQPFLFYRLTITQNGNNNNTQFAEWELFQRKHQVITIGDIPELTFGNEPFEIVASTDSELPVTLEIVSGPATLNEGFLTINGAGAVTLRASQAGDDNYFPASIERTFAINKAAQTIVFEPVQNKTYGDAAFELHAATASGLPLVFEVVSGPAAVADNVLSILGAGSVTVRARQEGNENYEPVSAEQTFIVDKAEQTITFEAVPPKNVLDVVTLSATATSGLPVLFDIISGPGALGGNALSFTGEGAVVVEASQPGNENYLAASTVEQTILADEPGFDRDGIKLMVAPNPSHGKVLVIILEGGREIRQYSFVAYDKDGRIIEVPVIKRHARLFEVDFGAYADGLYYLLITDGTQTTVSRVVKR